LHTIYRTALQLKPILAFSYISSRILAGPIEIRKASHK
jgi:hypothetical protein